MYGCSTQYAGTFLYCLGFKLRILRFLLSSKMFFSQKIFKHELYDKCTCTNLAIVNIPLSVQDYEVQIQFLLPSITPVSCSSKAMSEYDPRLVAPTCLYLASKAEESTVQAKLLVFYIRKLCNHLLLNILIHLFLAFYIWCKALNVFWFLCTDSDEKYRYDINDILQMEMKILEALNYYLVIYHPYRYLSQ